MEFGKERPRRICDYWLTQWLTDWPTNWQVTSFNNPSSLPDMKIGVARQEASVNSQLSHLVRGLTSHLRFWLKIQDLSCGNNLFAFAFSTTLFQAEKGIRLNWPECFSSENNCSYWLWHASRKERRQSQDNMSSSCFASCGWIIFKCYNNLIRGGHCPLWSANFGVLV